MKSRVWTLLPILALAAITSPAGAAPNHGQPIVVTAQDALSDNITMRVQASGAPGCAVAVIKDGKVVFSQGYGMADVENSVKATPNSVFEIGSVSKQFAATLIMMLVDEGKIGLDEKAGKYLELPKAWDAVTVRQLLTHTSGIPNYTDGLPFAAKMRDPGSAEAAVKLVAEKPLDFQPGTKWSYCNTGYCILGLIVEKLTSRTYADALHDRITARLQMQSTRMLSWTDTIPNRVHGYSGKLPKVSNAMVIGAGWPGAAGAIMSTSEDLAKWLIAQGSPTLLKPESWRQMWQPVQLADGKTAPYGFGWSLSNQAGQPVIGHGGSIPGFMSSVRRYPAQHLAVVVLVNTDSANPEDIAADVAAEFDPQLKSKPPTAITDPSPELTIRLKAILESGLKGPLNLEEFEGPVIQAIKAQGADSLSRAFGGHPKLQEFTLIEATDTKEQRRRIYFTKISDNQLKVTFTVAANQKITGFSLAAAR